MCAGRQLAVEPVEGSPGRNLDIGGLLLAGQDLLGPPDDEPDRLRRVLGCLADRLPHRLHHRRIDHAERRHLFGGPAVGQSDQSVTLIALAPLLDPAGCHRVSGRRHLGRLGSLTLGQRCPSRIELRPRHRSFGSVQRQAVQHFENVPLPPTGLFGRRRGNSAIRAVGGTFRPLPLTGHPRRPGSRPCAVPSARPPAR